MHSPFRSVAIAAFATLLFAIPALPGIADGGDFAAGSRVEGKIGSQWSRCTVVGERRATGGYMLRCDAHPDQENVFTAADVRPLQGPEVAPVRKVKAPAAPAETTNADFNTIPPRAGVYACLNQDGYDVVPLQFGLLDAHTYSTYDGGRGRYAYAKGSGVLTFTSGPFAGLHRSRETERTFRIIDEHGARTAFLCPWTPKDPRKLHW
jgi:hypothetical protein